MLTSNWLGCHYRKGVKPLESEIVPYQLDHCGICTSCETAVNELHILDCYVMTARKSFMGIVITLQEFA